MATCTKQGSCKKYSIHAGGTGCTENRRITYCDNLTVTPLSEQARDMGATRNQTIPSLWYLRQGRMSLTA